MRMFKFSNAAVSDYYQIRTQFRLQPRIGFVLPSGTTWNTADLGFQFNVTPDSTDPSIPDSSGWLVATDGVTGTPISIEFGNDSYFYIIDFPTPFKGWVRLWSHDGASDVDQGTVSDIYVNAFFS